MKMLLSSIHYLWWPRFVLFLTLRWKIPKLSHPPSLIATYQTLCQSRVPNNIIKGKGNKSYTDWLAPCPGLVQAALGLDTLSSKHNLFPKFSGEFRFKRELGLNFTKLSFFSVLLHRDPFAHTQVIACVIKPCSWLRKSFLSSSGLVLFSFFCQWAKRDSILRL